jgi:hypothetical protein
VPPSQDPRVQNLFLSKLGGRHCYVSMELAKGRIGITSHHLVITVTLPLPHLLASREQLCCRLFGFNPLLFVKHLPYFSLSIYTLCVAGIAFLCKMPGEVFEPSITRQQKAWTYFKNISVTLIVAPNDMIVLVVKPLRSISTEVSACTVMPLHSS